MELQGRGSGLEEEECVYVCERVHVCARTRKREGRECKLDVCQHIAYVQGLITNVSSLFSCGWKSAVAAWAGYPRKKNGNSKPCVKKGVFFLCRSTRNRVGLSLKSNDVT